MYKKLNELLGTEYRNNFEISWYELVFRHKLPLDFIREYRRDIGWGWNSISAYYVLSEDLIREFRNEVNWNQLVSSQLLSWEFMLEFGDKLSWDLVSLCQPYIDPDYSRISSLRLLNNRLYQIYQRTKDRGWFIGYVYDEEDFITIDNVVYTSFSPFVRENKVRVYWKDLASLKYINGKNYELIRKVKCIKE